MGNKNNIYFNSLGHEIKRLWTFGNNLFGKWYDGKQKKVFWESGITISGL
jgi:hypothetical protein